MFLHLLVLLIITHFLVLVLGLKDNGFFVADASEFEYIGYENLGNLTKMIPGLTDVNIIIFNTLKLISKYLVD